MTHLIAFKTADTSHIADVSLNDDPHLFVPVEANSVYTVTGQVLVSHSALGGDGINMGFSGGTGSLYVYGNNGTEVGAMITSTSQTFGRLIDPGAVSTLGQCYWIRGYLDTSGSPTNYRWRFAQNVSNGIASIVKEGSWMHLVKI